MIDPEKNDDELPEPPPNSLIMTLKITPIEDPKSEDLENEQ